MNPTTAKALSLIPTAPLCVRQTSTDYGQAEESRETRGIFNQKGQDLLYVTATSALAYGDEPAENNAPWRVEAAAVLAVLWAKSPELLAALDGLVEYCPTGATLPAALGYARRVRDEINAAMLAASENPTPAAE